VEFLRIESDSSVYLLPGRRTEELDISILFIHGCVSNR
jgi:hypothetical protein